MPVRREKSLQIPGSSPLHGRGTDPRDPPGTANTRTSAPRDSRGNRRLFYVDDNDNYVYDGNGQPVYLGPTGGPVDAVGNPVEIEPEGWGSWLGLW